jgi:hypothetical protein
VRRADRVGAVAVHAAEPAGDPAEQRRHGPRVVHVGRRDLLGHDAAGIGVDGDVELPPRHRQLIDPAWVILG